MKIAVDLFLAAYATLMTVVYAASVYKWGLQIPHGSRFWAAPLWEMGIVFVVVMAAGVGVVSLALWMWRHVWLNVKALRTPSYDDIPFHL